MASSSKNTNVLKSLLITKEDSVFISNNREQIAVSELVGKTILFYFSTNECPPCQRFKPKLIKAYNEIGAKDTSFDIVFVSFHRDQSSFDESYSTMSWLTLPFGDQRIKHLLRIFKLPYIPSLVAIGPNGSTITNKATDFIEAFGSDAYPFDEENLQEKLDDIVKSWPKSLNHELHKEHELKLSPVGDYFCDACGKDGSLWSFTCEFCDFDLDPKCALGDDNEKTDDTGGGDGVVCNGEVCYRAKGLL